MQFQVPQFIETEDKIVGPLTLRQFLYIGVASLISFFLFFALKTFLWFMVTAILGTIAAIFAFIKYNGQPMHRIVFSALKYIWQPRFYLWQTPQPISEMKIQDMEKRLRKIEIPKIEPEIIKTESKMPLLKSLWLKITTGSKILKKFGKKEEQQEIFKKIAAQQMRRIDYRV